MTQEEFDKITQVLCNTIKDLQKGNEELKELCDKYEEEHSNEFQCWKRDRKELLDKRGRIQKASEYIKHHTDKLTKIRVPKLDFNYEDLLEILEGNNEYNK